MTFKIGDKVRTTLEGDRYYNRVGIVKRGTLDAPPHEYYLVAFDTVEEWYQVDLLELIDTTTDHTAAVIEAARAVLSCVTIDTPDLLLDALVKLRIAIDAYDEAEIESDILTTESEG